MKTTHPSVAALAAVLLLAGCESRPIEETETSVAVPVTVQAARLDTIRAAVSATGLVTPAPGADWVITAPESARIVELPKAEGDRVRKGDLLVRFEIPSVTAEVAARRADIAQAEVRLENAKASVSRVAGLFDRGIAARKEVEDARRELAEAEATLAQARGGSEAAAVRAGRTTVLARFAGVVAKRWHNPGDLVDASSSDPILRIIDPDRLQVVAAVPVGALTRVVPGHRARVRVPGTEAEEPASVVTRPAAVDPASATADVRLVFARPTRLAAGTPVEVDITAEEHTDAVVAPLASIVHDGSDTFVMLAGEDGKAHRRAVTVGLTTRDLAEVTTGLRAGDQVIVQGQAALPDGAAIHIGR